MRRNYRMEHIGLQWLLQFERWNLTPYHFSTIDVLELKCTSCEFSKMTLQYTSKNSTKLYPQREGVHISLKRGHLKPGIR